MRSYFEGIEKALFFFNIQIKEVTKVMEGNTGEIKKVLLSGSSSNEQDKVKEKFSFYGPLLQEDVRYVPIRTS